MDKINLCNKRILVTGGNGYLGRNLIKKLISKKTLVFSLDIQDNCLSENSEYFQVDINDKELLNKAINDIQPSIIYHLAASLNRTRDFEY
ncbi:MAG: NAD-dependent epimerase/dehydratase family protein, partial [Bacteroidales bacterium]|nr:NAD-dependent epimerase/dehydratase family protein [Bacteroidales bacterium]